MKDGFRMFDFPSAGVFGVSFGRGWERSCEC